MSEKLAIFISKLFSPYFIAPLTILVVSLAISRTMTSALTYSALFFLICILPILIYVLVQMHRGIILDVHVKDREQRNAVYLIALVVILAYLVILYLLNAPQYLISIIITFFITGVLSYLINKKIKLSLHVVTMVGLTVILNLIIDYRAGVIGLIFTLLTMWARVKMKAHTLQETIVGLVVGVVITVGAMQLFL